jgi:DNA repair protein RecO (recombination protein O)
VVYQLVPELGLRAAPAGEAGLSGLQWQRVQAALPAQGGALAPLVQALADAQTTLRPQLRALLHYHSGVRVFQTRQVLLDVQRLAASP